MNPGPACRPRLKAPRCRPARAEVQDTPETAAALRSRCSSGTPGWSPDQAPVRGSSPATDTSPRAGGADAFGPLTGALEFVIRPPINSAIEPNDWHLDAVRSGSDRSP